MVGGYDRKMSSLISDSTLLNIVSFGGFNIPSQEVENSSPSSLKAKNKQNISTYSSNVV